MFSREGALAVEILGESRMRVSVFKSGEGTKEDGDAPFLSAKEEFPLDLMIKTGWSDEPLLCSIEL